ncbi:hypothetical protein [Mycobacteroides chelonae]|uniref:hypothetical protein n=1 Tax=Mycobacteroides chelonae TaxID=1774 RepID=UPI0008AA5917|nr:hypothetical protein [Mycobacteroides chelonae]OHU12894.1 hypothetical protein BKG75_17945 [Mycobacteroides chelonae]
MAEIRLFGVHSRGQVALLAVIATAVVALAAAMFYAGWSAGGRRSIDAADRPASAAAVVPVVLSSDQAAHQACLGYLSLARQWVSVTSDWRLAVRDAGKSWSFSDPAIREASDKLWEPQSRVATGLRGLVGPQTPAPIAAAIYRYVDVVLGFPYSIYDEERTTPVVQANIDNLMSAREDVLNACKGTGTPLP